MRERERGREYEDISKRRGRKGGDREIKISKREMK